MLNLQNDAVIICSKSAETESIVGVSNDAGNHIEDKLGQLEIEFSNLKSVALFGVDKTPLSAVQLVLP